jgi:exodeoxyribonuclease V alpha subunit
LIHDSVVRVISVRAQAPERGVIFTGVRIDRSGNVANAGEYVVIRMTPSVVAGAKVERGQWWNVAGHERSRTRVVDGYECQERQVEAVTAVPLRPSGEHIVAFIADNPSFVGIGTVKARRLWDAFGSRLYEILDDRDEAAISQVLSSDSARTIVDAWAAHGDTETLQWLHARGIDVAVGRKLQSFWGSESRMKVEEDPYRLLSFCATWKQVDELARESFGVSDDDPRRLRGAIEESGYQLFGSGHTVLNPSLLERTLLRVLGKEDLVLKATSEAIGNGSYVRGPVGLQPMGAWVMESLIAHAITARLGSSGGAELLPEADVMTTIAEFERDERFRLNDEQRAAVRLAAQHNFACITGGAGVGKTTVLKALYRMYDRAGVRVIQVALAGRAAKRMQETTGRTARTIASFLCGFKDDAVLGPTVLVVDEASMVDVITMSRLSEVLPTHVRILLVGDPAQLMPVGPGLVLHSVVGLPQVPIAELTVVKRYGNRIHSVAAAVRTGTWPNISDDPASPVRFVSCASGESTEAAVIDLYAVDPESTQILSARREGPGGIHSLNAACQQRFSSNQPEIRVWDYEKSRYVGVGLRQGDPVLCTRNHWDRGLQNGSLGIIAKVADSAQTNRDPDEVSGVLGWVTWDDGVSRPFTRDLLADIELGYAITVHKAQGSQWPRIIIPITKSRLLDRTLIYTAITRAQREVILVGEESTAAAAVRAPARATERFVALGSRLAALAQ